MEIEKCQSCGKPFKVWEHKLAMPGTKENIKWSRRNAP